MKHIREIVDHRYKCTYGSTMLLLLPEIQYTVDIWETSVLDHSYVEYDEENYVPYEKKKPT